MSLNIADIASAVAGGVPVKMVVDLSDNLDEKIDLIRTEVKEEITQLGLSLRG